MLFTYPPYCIALTRQTNADEVLVQHY